MMVTMPEFTVDNWDNNINIVLKVKGAHLAASPFISEQGRYIYMQLARVK